MTGLHRARRAAIDFGLWLISFIVLNGLVLLVSAAVTQ